MPGLLINTRNSPGKNNFASPPGVTLVEGDGATSKVPSRPDPYSAAIHSPAAPRGTKLPSFGMLQHQPPHRILAQMTLPRNTGHLILRTSRRDVRIETRSRRRHQVDRHRDTRMIDL